MVWDIAWNGGNSYTLSLEAAPLATTGTTDGRAYRSTDNGATWAAPPG
jgi:hypothetical protein